MYVLVFIFIMGRKAHFKRDEFMDAALRMVAERGPGALTVSALASGMKAPIGSVYHRFPSRDVLLAEMWIRVVESFQQGFLAALACNGLLASLYTVDWVREHPNEGRLLLLYRREDLLSGDWPEHLKDQVARLSRELDSGIRSFAEKRFGSLSRRNAASCHLCPRRRAARGRQAAPSGRASRHPASSMSSSVKPIWPS